MLKLLKLGGIPNVVSHVFGDKEFNLHLYKFGILAFKRRRLMETQSLQKNTKANKYLIKTSNRLLKYAKTNQWQKFNFLARKLLTSYAFQVQAYNLVYPKWMGLKASTVKMHLRKIRAICYQEATNLEITRVWIDKKPGDHGRPLGVPEVEWRVYCRMMLNLCEISTEGRNLYAPMQHGGRPGYGVGTCLQEVAMRLKKCHRVLEFDIRGFFDNIYKDSMIALLHPFSKIHGIMYELLRARPTKFKSFPDGAYEPMYEKIVQFALNKANPDAIREHRLHVRRLSYNWIMDFYQDALKILGEHPMVETRASIPTNPYRCVSLLFTQFREKYEFTSWGVALRLLERELFFGLMSLTRGVPQGTAFGTFMSSTTIGNHLRDFPGIIMYCDDGLIFLDENDPDPTESLEQAIKPLGLELHHKKTHIRDRDYLKTYGLKFLGTRMFLDGDKIDMRAETRGGSKTSFQDLLPHMDEFDKYSEARASRGGRMIDQHLLKIRLEELGRKNFLKAQANELLDASIKFGFFNYLLAKAYDPKCDDTAMRNAIIEGLTRSLENLKKNRLSLSHLLLSRPIWETRGSMKYIRPNIFNLSSFACNILLSHKKFFIFDRSNLLPGQARNFRH